MALHDKILKTLRETLKERNDSRDRTVRALTTPLTGMRPNLDSLVARIASLGQEIRALERAYAAATSEVWRWNSSPSPKLIVLAGPNDPEVLAIDELPEVLSTFTLDEVQLWARGKTGSLDLVTVEPMGSWRDDAFAYFTGELFLGMEAGAPHSIGTASWSRKL